MPTRKSHSRLILPPLWAVLLGPLVAVFTALAAQRASSSQQRTLADVKYLASDELEGRGVGTHGLDLAADYIREQFQKAGIKPALAGNSYFQEFQVPNGSRLGN